VQIRFTVQNSFNSNTRSTGRQGRPAIHVYRLGPSMSTGRLGDPPLQLTRTSTGRPRRPAGRAFSPTHLARSRPSLPVQDIERVDRPEGSPCTKDTNGRPAPLVDRPEKLITLPGRSTGPCGRPARGAEPAKMTRPKRRSTGRPEETSAEGKGGLPAVQRKGRKKRKRGEILPLTPSGGASQTHPSMGGRG
jgi:hypothetical protein